MGMDTNMNLNDLAHVNRSPYMAHMTNELASGGGGAEGVNE